MSRFSLLAVCCLLCLLFVPRMARANNVQIGPISLSDTTLSFTVSWENSWRADATAPYNYDGVWLFVKYQDCASNVWNHARIDAAVAGAPLSASTVSDQMGAFVFRSADGTGTVTNATVSLRMTGLPAGNFEFKVFGIEMVYVPEDSFYLGDAAATSRFRTGNQTTVPFYVTNDGFTAVANSVPNLFGGTMTAGSIPEAFPMGYNAFWCMKYEISQAAYVEFLNTLTSTQAASRYFVSTANRYTLTGVWPTISAGAGNRAMNFLSYPDITAWLDWAALRPMSEMEYEKACRGQVLYVPDELAWASTLVTDANTLANDGTPQETVSEVPPANSGLVNYNNSSVLGPLRNGFGGSATTNRFTLGATYYGICEMSGNVEEFIVSAAFTTGRTFVTVHGDGALDVFGLHDVADWPIVSGTGYRGGAWNSNLSRIQVSDRNNVNAGTNSRASDLGGRGVRNF
ncbi:MAG: SUMF1/EgtB/PvdO family nonheme iron enzyme [Bacteroidota bacterium]